MKQIASAFRRTIMPSATVPSFRGFTPSSPAASRVMRANRSNGGHAEQLLRSAIWRRGLRFRTHAARLPGKPDLVFGAAKVCVFCDGDFWHGRDWPVLRRLLKRRANAAYWIPKIAKNMARDREQARQLKALGWTVLRFWEGDILKDPDAIVQFVHATVRSVAKTHLQPQQRVT
jgi:DNA mismatch endonuclease (patch repair protein)